MNNNNKKKKIQISRVEDISGEAERGFDISMSCLLAICHGGVSLKTQFESNQYAP